MKKVCLLIVLALAAVRAGAADHADRIFVHGKIWTEDDQHPVAEAMAIHGDRIVAVGSDADIRALAGPDTAVVDLGGRLVVPGFNDAHVHFPGRGDQVELSGVESLREFHRRVVEFAAAHASSAWIRGGGWAYSVFPDQKADKKFLNEMVPDRPDVPRRARRPHGARQLEGARAGRHHARDARSAQRTDRARPVRRADRANCRNPRSVS